MSFRVPFIAFILAISFPVQYLSQDVFEGFRYRTEILIMNPSGSGDANVQILLKFDTASRIAEKKVRSDCEDLAFYYEEDASGVDIQFWIESGCGSSATQIWLNLPTVAPYNGTSIFCFYGREGWESMQDTFHGSLLFLSEDTCPLDAGWQQWVTPTHAYLLGDGDPNLFGDVGGEESHQHTLDGRTSTLLGGESSRVDPVSPGHGVQWSTHWHDDMVLGCRSVPPDDDNLIPWIGIPLCYYAESATSIGQFASGLLFIAETPFHDTDPDHFALSTMMRRRFPRMAENYEAGEYGSLYQHDHPGSVNCQLERDGGYLKCEDTGGTQFLGSSSVHRHDVEISLETSNHLPPYLYVIYEKFVGAEDSFVPSGAITIASKKPPLGWLEYTTLNGRFARGSYDDEFRFTEEGNVDHTHTWDTVTVYSGDLNDYDCNEHTVPGSWGAWSSHIHEITASIYTSREDNYPPYVVVNYYQKQSSAMEVVIFDNDETEFYWFCSGVWMNSSIVCSGENGICVGEDECVCEPLCYGIDCAERIGETAFLEPHPDRKGKNLVHVTYQAPVGVLHGTEMQALESDDPATAGASFFDCSMILHNLTEIGDESKCWWRLSGFMTAILVMDLDLEDSVSYSSVILYIKPITDQIQSVEVQIRDREASPSVLSGYWWVLPAIIVPFVMVIVVAVFVVAILVGRSVKKSREISRFGELDNFDVLLKEQLAAGGGDSGKRESAALDSVTLQKELFSIDYEDLALTKELGRGGSGAVVYLAEWSSQEVAVKSFPLSCLEGEGASAQFQREVELLNSLTHPAAVTFFGAFYHPPRIGLVMEYCSEGDLRMYVLECCENGKDIGMDLKVDWFRQIASVCEFLHSRQVIHRDMKCENVLLTAGLHCKLMDFGLSRRLQAETDVASMTKAVGTSYYMAPEMVLGSDYDEKVDVFAFGIMLWEIVTEDFQPYGIGTEFVELKVANSATFRPTINKMSCQRFLRSLARRCWQHEACDRPSFKEIVTILQRGGADSKMALYVRRSDQIDEEAEDCILEEATLEGLRRAVKTTDLYHETLESLPGDARRQQPPALVLTTSDGKGWQKELNDDASVGELQDDAVVVFRVNRALTKTAPSEMPSHFHDPNWIAALWEENRALRFRFAALKKSGNEQFVGGRSPLRVAPPLPSRPKSIQQRQTGRKSGERAQKPPFSTPRSPPRRPVTSSSSQKLGRPLSIPLSRPVSDQERRHVAAPPPPVPSRPPSDAGRRIVLPPPPPPPPPSRPVTTTGQRSAPVLPARPHSVSGLSHKKWD